VRIQKELRKEEISRYLLPLLRSYYEEDALARKLEYYVN
jgi:hypothetical protein